LQARKVGVFAHFGAIWNLFSALSIILLLAMYGIRGVWWSTLQNQHISLTQFTNLHAIMFLATQEVNASAAAGFFIYIRFMKYVKAVPRMDQPFRALGRATADLVAFGFIFVVVFGGFTASFHLMFGSDVYACRSLIATAFTLFQLCLGNFDFYQLMLSNRVATPVLFLVFLFLIVFTVLNIFVAIIDFNYGQVRERRGVLLCCVAAC
jgi:polycystin 1L2